MRCIVCHQEWQPVDGTQGQICDNCRDENPHAADRARMIEAAGEPLDDELERDWDREAIGRMDVNDNRW